MLSNSHYNDASATGVDNIFGAVVFAENSEHKMKNPSKKHKGNTSGTVQQDDKTSRMLQTYDKIMAASAAWVFETAKKNKCGRRSPLVSVTKIMEVAKKAGPNPTCLLFLLEAMLARCALHIIDEHCSTTALTKTVLPTLKGVFDMVIACKHCFVYETGSPEDKLINGTMQRPWEWHTHLHEPVCRSQKLMALSDTGKKVVKFMERCHKGEVDIHILEAIKY